MIKTDRTIRYITKTDQKAWDHIINHPLQSWAWGDFRSLMGLDVVRLGEYKNNTLTNGWQITFHKIPFTPFTVGYFPKGPKITDEMIRELTRLGKKKHALYIQMEPNMLAFESADIHTTDRLIPSNRPLFTKYTFVLDLTKTEDELLARMHPKTRYNIRVAQKHHVEIVENNSDKAFHEYLKLAQETTNRQGFFAHNRTYHKTMWNILQKAGIAHLFTASCEDTIVAAWIIFVWKDTIYYPYGASSRSHRESMAPNLMLWEITRWAKKQGLFYFDLWGAMGPNPDQNDPWYGFHRFKEGYTPDLVEFAGSYDLIIHPFFYTVFTLANSLRWAVLKRKL